MSSRLIGVGMAYSPFAQAPKSTILQRSLQNGLKALFGENSANLPHFGQATKRGLVTDMVVLSIGSKGLWVAN